MRADGRFSHERMHDRSEQRHVESLWSERSSAGMVVTAHYLATAAGVEMLEQGGNAVDAAIAASLALGVVESAGSGLGGMGLALVHLAEAGRTFVVDGSARAPRLATPEEVARSRRYRGYRAIAVPRLVAALNHLHRRYGRLGIRQIIEPAIRFAEDGFPVTTVQYGVARIYSRKLRRSTAAPFFLDEAGQPLRAGTHFRQPILAQTLRRISENGLEDFYTGAIASELVDDVRKNNGFLRADDLDAALEVREAPPLVGRFDDRTVCTIGPPGGGITLLQMLQMASFIPDGKLDPDDPEGLVRVAAMIRRARRDRARFRLRTGAEEPGEATALLELDYAERAVRETLDGLREVGGSPRMGATAGGETSHLNTSDAEGNVVSMTQSIERSFGACEVANGLGFVHNGYLRAFKIKNRKHPHFLMPGAPARSNAAPTFLLGGGRPVLAIGSTGSERMCSGMLEVMLRLRHRCAFASVLAPRLHCTPDSHVIWEADRFDPRCRMALHCNGFSLEALDPYSFKMGGLQLWVSDGRSQCGVSEPRRDGAAAGPSNQR
ncbi:MAG TPA: gamma-glutamyltransferase [Vicinamibacteria bacterium]|nr:gamma-glutamyltransferase [Vicinamibacteria bacterium]